MNLHCTLRPSRKLSLSFRCVQFSVGSIFSSSFIMCQWPSTALHYSMALLRYDSCRIVPRFSFHLPSFDDQIQSVSASATWHVTCRGGVAEPYHDHIALFDLLVLQVHQMTHVIFQFNIFHFWEARDLNLVMLLNAWLLCHATALKRMMPLTTVERPLAGMLQHDLTWLDMCWIELFLSVFVSFCLFLSLSGSFCLFLSFSVFSCLFLQFCKSKPYWAIPHWLKPCFMGPEH